MVTPKPKEEGSFETVDERQTRQTGSRGGRRREGRGTSVAAADTRLQRTESRRDTASLGAAVPWGAAPGLGADLHGPIPNPFLEMLPLPHAGTGGDHRLLPE